MTRRFLCQAMMASAAPVPAKRMRGRWAAWAGNREYSGTFTAVETTEPRACDGTWTLNDPNGRMILAGTWSARKLKDEWRGAWWAETKLSATYSGTWDMLTKLPPSERFLEMLQAALDGDVTGTWKASTGHSGTWAIRIDAKR